MKNITYMLLSTLILVALPAGCASKKKNAKPNTEREVTINNDVDSLVIASATNQSADATTDEEEAVAQSLSKF